MKKFKNVIIILFTIIALTTCVTNPLTGKKTMAFVDNKSLFPMAFSEYNQFLKEHTVVKGTPEAQMVERVGSRLAQAAQKWLAKEGYSRYLRDYRWEYNLVRDNAVNAWCMPGGKIVVYTGILPVTRTEEGLAVVMGHEIAHALLNHGQQNMSAGILQQLGALGVVLATSGMSNTAQSLSILAYTVGSTVLGTLPFSRENESEADRYGTILMAIGGYNPDEAIPFWQRMSALSGGGRPPELLSTHPSNSTRINNLKKVTQEAKKKAATFGVRFK
jgi:predicted Zn-dependent protease